ncbi:MAG: Crossover junction endodeoxyribonuclease RuvC [Candidatus Amesbacteria bacterium GW2011_GWA2_42_12]|uniref:Crossover junction endodeoxyribonuclease RuvC n=1 Tax=Candidatus Amesbacteria bacterium GW2011_GWA2_42_12 TaxID=1618356 RepID=A0A0G0Y4B9_9BACT|nr:MAG: Crossover junction endodeoxyribonuclease RuvC [Candidatus Amesbacteria bacterium GW2011_GWA2_42_12]
MIFGLMPNNMTKPEIILGIDPGFGRVGYGVIERQKGEWREITHGCIETSPKKEFVERLEELFDAVTALIKKYQPTRMAVEELFFFKNVTTAIQVGQARGAILLAGVQAKVPIDEFTPLQVKQSITGYGRAEKVQMQKMVAIILGMKTKIKSDDAADALAVALAAGQCLNYNNRLKNCR